MQSEELLSQVAQMRSNLVNAAKIADKIAQEIPEMEEPALRAQCSVIQAFLRQTERQERILAQMVKARQTGENKAVGF
ncbi:MAG: hypothetical protein AAF927_15815 [Bacteroidota bacterium]